VFDAYRDRDRLDFEIMQRSPIRLVSDRATLDAAVSWLSAHDYELVDVDASWLATVHMFRDLANAVDYSCHDQWQCLHEGIGERVVASWGRSAGLAFVLRGFGVFAAAHLDDASTLLDLIMTWCWNSGVRGHRVLCLVQSDDPGLRLRNAGLHVAPLHLKPVHPDPARDQYQQG
jgi:hypothetical protein